jgi:hypothetical protein
MNIPAKQHSSPWRYLWLIALMGLPALGWYGVLDQYSAERINSSISSAGLIYGTARGINALVSLLQGTELNVLLVTFSIGEVLDPVNDLIERFSDIVLLALGSLALQKILLAVVSATMFNILLSLAAVGTGLTLFFGSPKLLSTMLRTFLAITFFRFSLGLVVLANSWVDATFLDEADQQRHVAMEKFQGELREVDALTQNNRALKAQIADVQQSISGNEKIYRDRKNALTGIDSQIKTEMEALNGLIREAGGLCRFSHVLGNCPDAARQAKFRLKNTENKRTALTDALDALHDEMDNQREEIACLKKKQQGESCSFLDRFATIPDASVIREKLDALNADISDFSENIIDLLVSLLLKTIAIPLLFITALLKVLRINWARV